MQSLAKVQAGESCEIKWMFGNADVMNFLERYGIKEGSLSELGSGKVYTR